MRLRSTRLPAALPLLCIAFLAGCPSDGAPSITEPEIDRTAPQIVNLKRLVGAQELAEGATTETSELRVQGTVTDAVGATALSFRLNGAAEREVPGFAAGTQVPFDLPLVLSEGQNTIVLSARDQAGNVGTVTTRVNFTRPAGRAYILVSDATEAGSNDVAIDATGRLHVVWQDKPAGYIRPQVLYRSSADGGVTWSPIENLSRDTGRDAAPPRVLVDGAGRVYVLWTARTPGLVLHAGVLGELQYRVRENGAWSAPVQVGVDNFVGGWFPALDSTGRLHVVWTEHIPAGWTGEQPDYGKVWRTSLTGSGQAAKVLLHDVPSYREGGVIPLTVSTTFSHLSGYVDAEGPVRWTALRQVSASGSLRSLDIVHWTGVAERVLFPLTELGVNALDVGAPQLVRDANGNEHLIAYRNQAGVRAIVDFSLDQAPSATAIYQLPDGGSGIAGFRAGRAANGGLFTTVRARVASPGDFDLFLSTFAGGAWSAPANLTENGRRALMQQNVETRYSANASALAIDAAGRNNLVLTEQESRWTGGLFIVGSTVTRVLFSRF
jgi:hypothetical protein